MSEIRRFGMVIGIRPERLEEYRELHADSHPGVRDLLHAAHMRSFSIYLQRLPDGHHYLFGYYEIRRHRLRGGHGQTGRRAAQPGVAGTVRPDADPASRRTHLEADGTRLLQSVEVARGTTDSVGLAEAASSGRRF